MHYREDKYGNKLSVLGFGCMRFQRKMGSIDYEKAERQIMLAIQGGVNYFEVMAEDGFVEFKSDNDALFEFTLEEIPLAGLEMAEMTRDLHGPDSQLESRQVTTEYEDKFRAAGKNINYVKIKRKSSL